MEGIQSHKSPVSQVSQVSPISQASPIPYDSANHSKSTSPIRIDFALSSPAPDSSIPSPSDSLRSQLLNRNRQIAEEEEEEEENYDGDVRTPLSNEYQLSRGDSSIRDHVTDGVEEFSVSSSDDERLWEQTLWSRGMAGPKEISPRSVPSVSRRDIRGYKLQMVPNPLP